MIDESSLRECCLCLAGAAMAVCLCLPSCDARIDVDSKLSTEFSKIDRALEEYRLAHGRYPTTEQGLRALVRRPEEEPVPQGYPDGGYLPDRESLLDPWGRPYEYVVPGDQNSSSYDLWTLGSDGEPGGTGRATDVGNWPRGRDLE